jgi:exodeoxyribonuclease VII large subunit
MFSRVAPRLAPQLLRLRVVHDRERIAGLAGRARRCLRMHGERRRERFAAAAMRLSAALRANAEAHRFRIARGREGVQALAARAERALFILIDRCAARLDRAGQLLTAFSYQGVLARGFALVRGPDARPLRSAAAVGPGMQLELEFADGRVSVVASGGRIVRPPEPVRPRRRRFVDPDQGSLF